MAPRDTIAAVATASGVGAVGIVRISGPDLSGYALALTGVVPEPRHAQLSTFLDARGDAIDSGLVLYFPAPRSFTGEDVLELQGHGGPVVMDRLLRRVLDLGARLARPGEFTERAFLEGKLDLTRAEAIADLIASGTERQAKLAARSLQGAFAREVETLLDALTRERAYLEATLDFPDEDLDVQPQQRTRGALVELLSRLDGLLDVARRGERLRDGLLIVLAGPPNAGKSSLLNALSGSDRAIVTSVPGTTRDLLHADIEIDGLPLRIVDTAGFRRAADPVEREGLRRAREQIERADLVLWIIDDAAQEQEAGESGSPTSATDQGFPDGVPVLLVRNKIDLSGRPSGPVRESPQGQTLACSAETGAGLDALRTALQQHAGISADEGGEFSARRRHLDALKRTRAHLSAALDTSTDDAPPELTAEDLRLAQQALGEITGIVSSDDLLGKIFSEFCIGK